MKEILKQLILGLMWGVLGRRNLVRLSRFLLNESRLDVPNDMEFNGELIVQHKALACWEGKAPFVACDVGANVGLWSRALVSEAKNRKVLTSLYAFEPCRSTMLTLRQNLDKWGISSNVSLVPLALSSTSKQTVLFSEGANAGRNGLYAIPGSGGLGEELIACVTLDDFSAAGKIGRINLIKIDTEGHDLEVLRGAKGLLERKAIDVIQFEYNSRWIDARSYLRDAFELFGEYGYRLGKVTPRGIECYEGWDPELESFREGNYLALLPGLIGRFPIIKWWNSNQ